MAEKHSRAERLKLKNVLCDAIRVLCQNTVRFNARLSVEALIGITVDDGSDVLIVSLNEMVGAGVTDTAFADEHHYRADAVAAFDDSLYHADMQADDLDMDGADYWDKEDTGADEYGNSEDPGVPYGTVIKEELTSTITYNDGMLNRHQQPAVVSRAFKTEPYAADNSEVPYYDEAISQQNYDSHQGWESKPRQTPAKTHIQGFGTPKRPKPATVPRKKFQKVGSKVPQGTGMAGHSRQFSGGSMQSMNGEDSQITLYTCGICGAQMQNKTSLHRHKMSHTGRDLCRCEACGKTVKRRDSLLRHQNTCAAYVNLVQQHGGGSLG